MIFQSIFENFQHSSNGTDAFKQLKIQCEHAIQHANDALNNSPSDLLSYSALFLIYGFAKNYVLLYEDQAVTSAFAQHAKNQLINYMSELNQALQHQDATLILSTLNDISKHYFAHPKVF